MQKSPGQIAFENDVAMMPTYDDGSARHKWSEIGDMARLSWERNPSPRPHMYEHYKQTKAAKQLNA